MLGVVLPILPGRRHRGGLESVALPLPTSDWHHGVIVTPVCGVEPFVWGCESASREAPDDVKPITPILDSEQFDSTLIGVLVDCDGGPGALGSIEEIIASEGWRRTAWQAMAGILHNGEVGTAAPNPSLESVAILPPGWDPLVPAGIVPSLQGLLDAACTCWNADLVIHVPVQFLPYFLRLYLVEWDNDDQVYRMGAFRISFDCYPNVGPDSLGPDAEPNPDGSEVWMYATGPIYYGIVDPEIIRTREWRQNKSRVEDIAGAIVAFEPCCVMAVKATVC